MRTQSSDTHPEVERILIDLTRKVTVAEKFSQVRELSNMAMQLSRRAIARANPGLSENEVDLLFVKYHYGDDVANRLKNHLEKRQDEKR
ncbi:hypothetical protein IIC38_18685 [candidate division KSB1 bacterium]|nr:hypothetical protein [candidate division KSB1 bacterium]